MRRLLSLLFSVTSAAVAAVSFYCFCYFRCCLCCFRCCLVSPRRSHHGAQNGSPNDQKTVPKCSQNGSQNDQKLAPGGLRGPPGDPLGPRGLPGRYKNRPRSAPGGLRGRTKISGSGRGASRKVLGPFFNVLRRPRVILTSILGASGCSRGVILEAHCQKPPNPGF